MRSFVAKRFETRPAGLSLDTEALARYADVIDLSIGDTDFTTDKRIIDAAYADALNGYTHYGDPKGDPELVDAVIQAWKEDFGQDIPREEVVFAMDAIVDPVSLYEPVYDNGGDAICVMDQVRDTKNTDESWTERIALKDALKLLDERERRILSLRFYEGKTQMEVSREVGISQAQVSRLEKGAINTIKKHI